MPPIPVYVLVGGASRRFGADKATTLVDGEPWALHVGRRLAASGEEIVLVGPTTSDVFDPHRRIDDCPGVTGPVAGVLAALQDRREKHGDGLLVLASCDLVRPERAWRAPLVAEFDSGQLLHIAAYHAADRWQPFPSVAHTRWLAPLREQVAAGIRSMQAAFDRTKSAAVTWRGASGGPPQANTVEALRAELDPQPSGGSPRF